jgi:two-component system LytT family response regulator
MIRTVIIEDETKTRESLEYLLQKYCPDVTICGAAPDFEQGYALIKKEKPSLVFMDIQLNSQEGNGLELINSLDLNHCAVIFISGYKDYAVEAFRLKAVDYLLKPVRINHLTEAVEKAKKSLSQGDQSYSSGKETKNHTFHIPSQNGFILIKQQDIIRCEADGAYTHFYINGKSEKITSSINIGQIEQKLSSNFLRIHKSHIINKHFIVSYSKGEGLMVKMSDHFQVPVSRAQKDNFFSWLS